MIMNTRRTGRFSNICMVLESMNSKKSISAEWNFECSFTLLEFQGLLGLSVVFVKIRKRI